MKKNLLISLCFSFFALPSVFAEIVTLGTNSYGEITKNPTQDETLLCGRRVLWNDSEEEQYQARGLDIFFTDSVPSSDDVYLGVFDSNFVNIGNTIDETASNYARYFGYQPYIFSPINFTAVGTDSDAFPFSAYSSPHTARYQDVQFSEPEILMCILNTGEPFEIDTDTLRYVMRDYNPIEETNEYFTFEDLGFYFFDFEGDGITLTNPVSRTVFLSLEDLDPSFSIFTAGNPFEPLSNNDSFYSSEELGYTLSFTDSGNIIDSVDLMASSSCLQGEAPFVLENIHVGNTGFSDSYFSKTINLNIGDRPDYPFKWWNPDFTRSPEFSQKPTCTYQTYLKFNFYDGGSIFIPDNIYTVTNVLIQTGEGIFGLTLDLPLPERTPAFFLAIWNGLKVPFVDVNVGIEPFINFLWSFIGQLFTNFVNIIPVVKDIPDIIAPVPGESIPQLTNEFGLNWGNISPAGNQVVYSRLGTQSTQIFDVLARLFCFIWVFQFFFVVAFFSKDKEEESSKKSKSSKSSKKHK